jgi:hypothetical protein
MRRRLARNQLSVFFKVFHEITGDRIFAFIAFLQFLQIALSTNNHPNHTMKHSEWLRLKAEGDKIVASLREILVSMMVSHFSKRQRLSSIHFLWLLMPVAMMKHEMLSLVWIGDGISCMWFTLSRRMT